MNLFLYFDWALLLFINNLKRRQIRTLFRFKKLCYARSAYICKLGIHEEVMYTSIG
jgi:hypothetical protein